MPQISITAWTKTATAAAGQRRSAPKDFEYDSEEIEVTPASIRTPLKTIPPAQAQNKRQRVLDCVLIPTEKRVQSSAINTFSNVSHPRAHASSSAAVAKGKQRASRIAQRPVYDELSEDELAAATEKPKRGKKVKVRPHEDSDFEDVQRPESEDDFVNEDVSDASNSGLLEEASDEDVVAPKKKAKASMTDQQSATTAKKKPTGTGRSQAGSSKNMKSLATVEKGSAKGLDLRLPPLHDLDDIFQDITDNAITFGFGEVLKHLNGSPLRVATMCSGTESPILALEMICDALKKHSDVPLTMDHVFSAEIVPFKQAYIERNFNPPIIFRDITELTDAMNDEHPTATTAYGSKVAVPTRIHLLIAGTSCVDFSKLNNHKKTLSDDGESGKTWEAVLSYCKAARPTIVVLENVKGAEWDRMLAEYEAVGYQSAGVHVDTKHYYLPQTRQRGYMICFNKDRMKAADLRYLGAQWQGMMQKFKRPASSPVSSFLLPTDQISAKEQGHVDDAKREVDWVRCAESHVRYRQGKRLGTSRPYTHWQESGTMIVPENGSATWWHGQVERVRDLLDCSLLRKALENYDIGHKTRILDVSQNVYMNEDTAGWGITGCLTPMGHFFLSDAGRAMTAEENLRLQGIHLKKISLTTETSREIQDLAGNAMTSTVVGPAIISGLIAGHKLIEPLPDQQSSSLVRKAANTHLVSGRTRSIKVISDSEIADVSSLLAIAGKTIRRCYCEGSSTVTKREIQQCRDCGHTTCISCGGHPQHNYCQDQRMSKGRILPQDAEAELRSKLPLQLRLSSIEDAITALRQTRSGSKHAEQYVDLVEKVCNDVFSIQSVRRVHHLSLKYTSATGAGHLELILDDDHAEWRLFVYAPTKLAANDPLREILQQPVATCPLTASLFGDSWRWRLPLARKTSASIQAHGEDVPTWWARNEMPDFRDHKQPQYLTVKLSDETPAKLRAAIEGTYRYLPRCGTACESLYKNVGTAMNLFLDPTRVGDPNKDQFVFSEDVERMEYGDIRPTIARVDESWRPWTHEQDVRTVSIALDAEWIDVRGQLRSISTTLDIRASSDYDKASYGLDCSQSTELISCGTREMARLSDVECESIEHDDSQFFTQNAWLFESLRRHIGENKWHSLDLLDDYTRCHTCAPERPKLRWKLTGDGDSIEPYEEPRSAGEYERFIKARPTAIAIEAQRSDHQSSSIQLKLGANLVSMAHRVQARLPDTVKDVKFSWRLRTNFNPSTEFSFRAFSLRPIQNVRPYSGDLQMTIELFPNQLVSLAWMRRQEAGDGQQFIIEESDEERLPRLGWAVETRAQASVRVRGGICADHPGYGKSILTLALIQSQFLDKTPDTVLDELRDRQSDAQGLIPTTATLVICPRTLVDQWVQEAQEKLGLKIDTDVFSMKIVSDLDKKTLEQLSNAKLVVVSSSVLISDQYAERLAAFAGVPGPAAAKGRAFEQWLEYATRELPEHVQILQQLGRHELRRRVKEKYLTNINSEAFKAAVPSRRLRGKEYVAAQQLKSKSSATKTAASSSLEDSTIGYPLLEMFHWNRVVFDEFHLFDSRQLAVCKSLKKDKVWGLSGTPSLGDFYDVARMGELIGVPLRIGSDSRGVMKQKNIRELRKEMTDFERFDSMRQMPSGSILSRIHEVDQMFLDKFVTRNVTDFKMDFEDHLVPVVLDLTHRAIYTEVSQHMNSIEMRLKKGRKSKNTDRERRLYEAADSSETAEESLSKIAAFLDHDNISAGCQSSGVGALIERRHEEMVDCKAELHTAILAAEEGESVVFEQWRQARIHLEVLGEEEILNAIQSSCSNSDEESKNIAATKLKSGGKEDRSQGLTSTVNSLVSRLLVSCRSLRFVQNVRSIQQTAKKGNERAACDNVDCQSSSNTDVAVSGFCGHMVCSACYIRMKENFNAQCPAKGCHANMKDIHLLWKSKMGDRTKSGESSYGAKIDAAIKLLRDIERKGDQAILFVQYENRLHEVGQALEEAQIAAMVLDQSSTASRKIDAFKSPQNKITTIVLNASDETATGLNLQNANHVIFLSPLLRDQQYSYDATMAQAIGRVRRHGQTKQIHVCRIIALDTIDVDILEHRERRSTAITEYGSPKIDAPPQRVQGYVKVEPTPERTQLVREDGMFSLRPQSWLVRCGADSDEEELNKIRSSPGSHRIAGEQRFKMKGRVVGWEDFSSLIKFSRAYTEDDE